MNKVQLLGRLTKEVDLKMTMNNRELAQFTLAVDVGKDAEGNKKTVFIPCTAWERKAEALAKYVGKGQRLLVTNGALMMRSYKDKQGQDRVYTYVDVKEFEFVETRASREQAAQGSLQIGQQYDMPAEEQAPQPDAQALPQPVQQAAAQLGGQVTPMTSMFDDVDVDF